MLSLNCQYEPSPHRNLLLCYIVIFPPKMPISSFAGEQDTFQYIHIKAVSYSVCMICTYTNASLPTMKMIVIGMLGTENF